MQIYLPFLSPQKICPGKDQTTLSQLCVAPKSQSCRVHLKSEVYYRVAEAAWTGKITGLRVQLGQETDFSHLFEANTE